MFMIRVREPSTHNQVEIGLMFFLIVINALEHAVLPN